MADGRCNCTPRLPLHDPLFINGRNTNPVLKLHTPSAGAGGGRPTASAECPFGACMDLHVVVVASNFEQM